MTKEELRDLQEIYEALVDAQEHLEYCGYGDKWERDCAFTMNLPQKIETAISVGSKYFPKD